VITAVDTNVLLDIFTGDADHGPASRDALDTSLHRGSIIVSDIVWGETAAAFPTPEATSSAMAALGAVYTATVREAADAAGVAWRAYRTAGGPRTRVVADFLVASHALVQADRLLTRDRGFYRRYFPDLSVLDPSQA
jgi:hypothetical protein